MNIVHFTFYLFNFLKIFVHYYGAVKDFLKRTVFLYHVSKFLSDFLSLIKLQQR